jgi:hypothetical protein
VHHPTRLPVLGPVWILPRTCAMGNAACPQVDAAFASWCWVCLHSARNCRRLWCPRQLGSKHGSSERRCTPAKPRGPTACLSTKQYFDTPHCLHQAPSNRATWNRDLCPRPRAGCGYGPNRCTFATATWHAGGTNRGIKTEVKDECCLCAEVKELSVAANDSCSVTCPQPKCRRHSGAEVAGLGPVATGVDVVMVQGCRDEKRGAVATAFKLPTRYGPTVCSDRGRRQGRCQAARQGLRGHSPGQPGGPHPMEWHAHPLVPHAFG